MDEFEKTPRRTPDEPGTDAAPEDRTARLGAAAAPDAGPASMPDPTRPEPATRPQQAAAAGQPPPPAEQAWRPGPQPPVWSGGGHPGMPPGVPPPGQPLGGGGGHQATLPGLPYPGQAQPGQGVAPPVSGPGVAPPGPGLQMPGPGVGPTGPPVSGPVGPGQQVSGPGVGPTGPPVSGPGVGPPGFGVGPPPGQPVSGPGVPHPGLPPHPGYPGPGYPPPWSPQAPPAPVHRPPGSGRVGKVVAICTAAVVLAVGSGLLGGWVATQADDDAAPTSAGTRTAAAAAPIIERSSLAGIAEAVLPTVVSISTGRSEGSGVVLSADGFILTNNHVVAGASGDQVGVAFSNGKTARAKIVGTDARTDLGVIKVDGVTDLRAAAFGDSSAMRVGDTVLALGSPLGLQGSVTAGIVSALNRTIRTGDDQQSPPDQPNTVRSMSGLLQTDAPINPGNSGGALVNTNGEVIGINTAIATSGQGQGNIGVGFAIPSNKAKLVAEQLRSGQKVSHPFLGVEVTNSDTGGALVGSVQADSPAAKAGLQKGDIVVKLGDKEINDSDDLVSAVQTGKVGDRLSVTYIRNGEQRTTTVTLGEAS